MRRVAALATVAPPSATANPMDTRRLLLLPSLRDGESLALLALRVVTGAFLVHGVWDNITEVARMEEFVAFQRQFGFPWPQLLAPLSVWMQFAIGVLFILGLLVRWAGIACAVHFVVACVMVHWNQDFRGWWPALALVLIGLLLATRGGGRIALDRRLGDPG